jgi:peptidoglycan/LPS O-acetylase OafA/YrhL
LFFGASLDPGGIMRADKTRFVALDGLRGAAALVVVTAHIPGAVAQHFIPAGPLAVDFFFTLSGFVLSHAYQDKLIGGFRVIDFMRLRLIRLYPLYLVGAAVGAGGMIAAGASLDFKFAASLAFGLLFLPTPWALSSLPRRPFPFDLPAWSLFPELAANLAFALVARVLSRAWLATVVVLSACVLVATALGCRGLYSAPESYWVDIGRNLARVAFSFFCGVGLFRLWAAGCLPRLSAPGWLPMVLLISVTAIPADNPVVQCLIVILAWPSLIALAAASREPSGLLARACATLGAASYALYILHAPAITWLMLGSERLLGAVVYPQVKLSIVLMAALLVVAMAADHFFDAPVRRWLGRLAGASRPGRHAPERARPSTLGAAE